MKILIIIFFLAFICCFCIAIYSMQKSIERGPNWIGEASRQSFAIRAEYEKKTDDILTNKK